MGDRQVDLVDAHCHLDELSRRGLEPEQAVMRAHRAGVHQLVTSGDGLEDSREAAAIADRLGEVYFTVGWHPVNPKPPTPAQIGELRHLLEHPKAVAVGEVGLDYYFRPGYLETPPAVQQAMFRQMLELAAEVGKPVVVHQRQAERDLIAILDQGPSVPVMLHCFSGGLGLAQAAAERGLMCSFAGNLTFRSAADLHEAAAFVSGENLMLETDAPFLAPEPHRGQLCEPAMVRATAQWLAARRGDCLESLAAATTAVTRAFFRLPPA